MISEEIISKIKEENDIVDIISQDVRLKRAGENYKGLCPFHNEKSPSFVVSPQKQIYKCFGCGEAGSVITYVMKTKKLSFPEACEELAERVNIQIKTEKHSNYDVLNEKKKKMYGINVEAARFFFNNLKKVNSAKEYFTSRGITQKTINRFGLGYAMDSWNAIMNYLKSKGYSELDLLDLGLIVRGKNNSEYDRFRNRVIFPVFDVRGRVIGFGGRVLDDSKPKYLNSPETLIFNKGTNLYGLNFAIKNMSKRSIIIVEGYMDCISLSQYGITNVVASLGTAFTEKQAKLLKRYADEIIISFDSDAAGVAAAMRGIEILRKEGFDIKLLTVTSGKDPDEFIKKYGRDEFLKIIERAEPLLEYKLRKAKEGINFNNQGMLVKYIKSIADILVDIDPVQKDIYVKKISEDTGISENAIYEKLNLEIKYHGKKTSIMNENTNISQKLYLEPAFIKAERNILKLMLNFDTFSYIIDRLNGDDILIEEHKKIFELIKKSYEVDEEKRIPFIESRCQDLNSSREFAKILDLDINIEDDEKYLAFVENCVREIRKSKLEESKKNIMKEIKRLEKMGQIERCINLAEELVGIENQLTALSKQERR